MDSKSNTKDKVVTGSELTPLPLGPGGKNSINSQFNNINNELTKMSAQATANTKYDPPTPIPETKAVTKETFVNDSFSSIASIASSMAVVGVIFFVYGLLDK
jgi:hypothetical protein